MDNECKPAGSNAVREMTLLEKLLEIRKSVDHLQKDKTNEHFKFDYVSSNRVLASIRKRMNELGVLLIPTITGFDNTSEKLKLIMNYTWTHACNPTEKIEIPWYGQSEDPHDQGFGKALTYAEKYFILKFFQIPTDEDDPDADLDRPGRKPADSGPEQKPGRTGSGAGKTGGSVGATGKKFDPNSKASEKQIKMVRGRLAGKGYDPEVFNLGALKTAGTVDMALQFIQDIPSYEAYSKVTTTFKDAFGEEERYVNFKQDYRNFIFNSEVWQEFCEIAEYEGRQE